MARRAQSIRRGFTLVEILVAVAVLVVVILICGQAFQAASAVARQGEASGDALQEAWTVKSQIEDDLSRISPDGALVIHSVEVPNDFNRQHWSGTGPRPGLINPALPASAPVRCDQLLFFTSGFEPSAKYGSDQYSTSTGVPRILGGAACIAYGHGLQFSELAPYSVEQPSAQDETDSLLGQLPDEFRGHDVDMKTKRFEQQDLQPKLAPFYQPNVANQWGGNGAGLPTKYTWYGFTGGGSDVYRQTDGPLIQGAQPEARRWLLTRQAVALADDDLDEPGGEHYPLDVSKRIYRGQAFAAESLFPADPRRQSGSSAGFDLHVPVVDYGRVDVAAMLMGSLRESLLHSRPYSNPDGNFARRPWDIGIDNPDGTHAVLEDVRTGGSTPAGDGSLPGAGSQRDLLKSLLAWPRVERTDIGPSRYDQALVTPVLASACSSFIVEWTWDEDTGETRTWQMANPSFEDGRLNEVTWPGFRYTPSELNSGDWTALGLDPPPSGSQLGRTRWFGLPALTDGDGVHPMTATGSDPAQFDRGVCTFRSFATHFPGHQQPTGTPDWVYPGLDENGQPNKPINAAPSLVHPAAVDEEVAGFGPIGERVREYWAVFGPNRRWPLLEGRDEQWGGNNPPSTNGIDGTDDPDPSYTPWPTALRITMVLHDPATNLEHGKEIQFVVELPRDRLQ